MAFTRVRGPGITTDDNYRVGILTATKFVGPMQASGDSDFTNISATGIGTIDGVKIGDPSGIVTASSSSGIVTYYGDASKLTGLTAGQIPNLDGAKITSGTVATARLGSGTANNTSFLRGDQTWASNTSTTINSNTDNYLITGTGTADTLQGESNLTFNGNRLTVDGDVYVSGSQNAQLTTNQLIFDRAGYSYIDNSNDAGSLVFRVTSGNTIALRLDNSAQATFGSNLIIPDAIQHLGDLDCKIRFPGTDTITFETAGYERLRILSDGEVRINNVEGANNDPAHLRLHHGDASIVADDRIGQIRFAGRDSGGATVSRTGALIQATAAATWDTGQSSGYSATHLDFFTQDNSGTDIIAADSPRMRITSDGKIGIGTDAPADALSVYKTNSGNPIGITIRNTNTNNYSHGRLRIESQNGAKYTDIWTDVPNDACRIGYNSSNALYINGGNAFANTAVTNWHGDYKVFQAGQASLSGKNPQDGSPLYLSNNAYYDTTNSRWEFISTDDASQIEMENGSIKFKNGGTGSANGAITWVTNAWFNQSGNFRFRNGRGIDFGETSDVGGMVSEVLDDYEEGSFTMFFWCSNTNFSTQPTMTANNCRYTKIGNKVTFTAYIAWGNQAAGGSGNLYLGGLPYAVNNYQAYGGVYFGWHNIGGGFAAHEYPTGYINNNSTNIVLMRQPIGSGGGRTYSTLACSALHGGTGTYSINGTYLTNS